MNPNLQTKYKIDIKNRDKNDSKKKEKGSFSKGSSTASLFRKADIKKTPLTKKQESPSVSKRTENKNTPYQSSNNSNSNASIGSSGAGGSYSIGTPSTKYVLNSIRASPKSSLADLHSVQLKKVAQQKKKKIEFTKISDKQAQHSSKKVKEEVKKSLAKVIKAYNPQQKSYLDVSMTEVTSDGQMKDDKLSRVDFNFIEVIGEGGYGKVWKVEHLKTRGIFAMKEMSKALIIMKKSVDNVLNELKILSNLKSPFISNMICAFNDRDNLYLGMDYLEGGDFRCFLGQSERLNEHETKFLIACVIKGIEYIHKNKIFHRDIKPENLVLDEKGYLRITDFGIARLQKDKNNLDASGTPGYMAPQVICKQVHSFPVDFYALGIICYELMLGKRPYTGHNRAQIRDAILSKQHSIKKKQIPCGWSPESADFVNKLIMRQPAVRLGSKSGVSQLINHPWFHKFPWKQLEQKKLISPIEKNEMKEQKIQKMDEYDEAVNQYKLLQRTNEKVDIFGGYFSSFK